MRTTTKKVHLHKTPEFQNAVVAQEPQLTPHVKPTWSEQPSPVIVELVGHSKWKKLYPIEITSLTAWEPSDYTIKIPDKTYKKS